MSHKVPVDVFKWIENISEFSKDFMENYSRNSNERFDVHINLPFLLEGIKVAKSWKTWSQVSW